MSTTDKIQIGTRGSKLALWQAQYIQQLLHTAGMQSEIHIIETTGDKMLNQPLASIGAKGLFTKELETKLLSGEIDIAVHSAKDVPSELSPQFEILAFSKREKPTDVLVSFDHSFSLQNCSSCVVGTSSVRRKAFLKSKYPNITIQDARGNLQTRFRKMQEGKYQAMVLAYAGVYRMQLHKYIVEEFPIHDITPPVGQGAIAIECAIHLDHIKKKHIQQAVNDKDTERCIIAERAFLQSLGGGCSIPIFAHAQIMPSGKMHISGGIIHPDGTPIIKHELQDKQAYIGERLAKILIKKGADKILKEIQQP